ncbi:hypothetical protein K439DRAFT_1625513 [Ramaria rubella]|nr:hypothetical protein K439DRAFT_1625513 [Ramaria rubella]
MSSTLSQAALRLDGDHALLANFLLLLTASCSAVGSFEESNPVMGLTIYPSGANDDGTLVSVELQRSSHVDRADHGDKPLPFTIQGVDANLAMELAVQQDVIDELA